MKWIPRKSSSAWYGDAALPTLVYLPGLHGDWTLVASFRAALNGRARFVEVTYPRTLTWTIDDYANAIRDVLVENGITRGWLLAESFGSQPAWPLVAKSSREGADEPSGGSKEFRVEGLILAAGFVKHPCRCGPFLLRWFVENTPPAIYRALLKFYTWYAHFRHRHAPETLANIAEFVARRTPLDRQAMRHRLALLDEYDPRRLACRTTIPVHYLAGLVDPLVPWPLVRVWLRKNCPGHRPGKTIWLADHNVLASAPAPAAKQVLEWMLASKIKTS